MVLVMPPAPRGAKETEAPMRRENLPTILYRRASVREIDYRLFGYDLSLEQNIVIASDQPDAIRQLVKLGLGMAVLPYWSVVEDRRSRHLAVSRLRGGHLYNYGVLSRRSGYRPKALNDLLTVSRRWREWWPLAGEVHDPI